MSSAAAFSATADATLAKMQKWQLEQRTKRLTDQPDGEAVVREVYGDKLAYVPYTIPGFALAKSVADVFDANPKVEGLVLLQHGIFTVGGDARVGGGRAPVAGQVGDDHVECLLLPVGVGLQVQVFVGRRAVQHKIPVGPGLAEALVAGVSVPNPTAMPASIISPVSPKPVLVVCGNTGLRP